MYIHHLLCDECFERRFGLRHRFKIKVKSRVRQRFVTRIMQRREVGKDRFLYIFTYKYTNHLFRDQRLE